MNRNILSFETCYVEGKTLKGPEIVVIYATSDERLKIAVRGEGEC